MYTMYVYADVYIRGITHEYILYSVGPKYAVCLDCGCLKGLKISIHIHMYVSGFFEKKFPKGTKIVFVEKFGEQSPLCIQIVHGDLRGSKGMFPKDNFDYRL